ncbi:MAG: methyltransferase [Clostridiales bacterium]|nr:methyltransferase [Clostridiales bacterium]
MTSRERVRKAINHEPTDRVPIDLGGTACSGIHAVALKKLREALKLEDRTPKVIDPMMFISDVDEDVRQALGVDCVGIYTKGTLLGYRNENYKPWNLPDGTEVLMGGGFQCTYGDDGCTYTYPQGDTSVAPSARMTKTGFYFDNITRQEDLNKKEVWDGREDYKDQYSVFSDQDLKDIEDQVNHFYNDTEYSLIGNYWNGGIGDNLHVPGAWLKNPKGIRSIADWFMYMHIEPDYYKDAFAMITEITLKNMELYYQVAGNKLDVMVHTGTDFAHQHGLLISPDMYRELFQPYHKQVNDWIHKHTEWKTFIHCCGSVVPLVPDFIDAGFDILNPIQVSADNMDAAMLKEKFGKDIVFWGGGCDPQKTLPQGTPEEVYQETKRNAEIFSKGGGFIGGNVHNLQYGVPSENFLAEVQALKDTVPGK